MTRYESNVLTNKIWQALQSFVSCWKHIWCLRLNKLFRDMSAYSSSENRIGYTGICICLCTVLFHVTHVKQYSRVEWNIYYTQRTISICTAGDNVSLYLQNSVLAYNMFSLPFVSSNAHRIFWMVNQGYTNLCSRRRKQINENSTIQDE